MSTTSTPTLPTSLSASHTTTSTGTPSCTNATPGKYGHVDDLGACNAYFSYNPSFTAAILFTVLFGILSVSHIFQAFYYKKKFTWVIIMGTLWELGSFATRTVATRNQQSIALVIVSQLLFLLAPLWINAFVYMTLGRLVYFFHPRQRCFGVKAQSITKYFVWADIFSFLVQGAGGSMMNPGNSAAAMKNGSNIYMAGMGLQEAFIVFFAALGVKFQIDMQNFEARGQAHPGRKGWKLQIYTVYAVLLLITIRIIFRLIEFTRGADIDNPILRNEVFIYVLDAMPMFWAILLLSVLHSGRVLRGPDSEFPKLSRKEKKALKQRRKEEKAQRKFEKKYGKAHSDDGELGVLRQ